MVTDEERDYMYLAYGLDPRMRINVGIRRRLAPLMENNRRRIELLNSILLSFPGTPILYYGDEIGMGDNIYLGDRHGVRTPMQWSADRNAGFSRATPARLYSPVIMDPVYGYEAVNVEAQQGDPSSLLHWTKHMIALRKLFKVFGRGSIEFLSPANRKILAYIRSYDGEQVLCVANLSRFAQPFDLDLSTQAGKMPVEMLGYVEFPRIGKSAYPLTLGPYGYLWFELHGEGKPAEAPAAPPEEFVLGIQGPEPFKALLEPASRALLESRVFPDYLARQRWFGGESRSIRSCRLVDVLQLSASSRAGVVEVDCGGGEPTFCFIPLAIASGPAAEDLRMSQPGAVLCLLRLNNEPGILYDAVAREEACRELLRIAVKGQQRGGEHGTLRGKPGEGLQEIEEPEGGWPVTYPGVEGGHTHVVYGDQLLLKLFRQLIAGPQPDCEITRYLTEHARFSGVPAFAGVLEYLSPDGEAATIGMLQRLVPHQGDGWRWMQEELGRYYERAVTLEVPTAPPPDPLDFNEEPLAASLDELLGISDDAAAALGRRTAEMHLALARPTDDPAFTPERMTAEDLAGLADRIRRDAAKVFSALKAAIPRLPDDVVEQASRVLSYRGRVWTRLERLRHVAPGMVRTRIHGDYHLAQVLRVGHEFMVMGFDGQPGRSLEERRAKQSPLRDVSGMLRSFGYASQVALMGHVARRPADLVRLLPWAEVWERSVSGMFLQAYRKAAADAPFVPAGRQDLRHLMEVYLLDMALHELRFELENRPAWVRIPLLGLLALEGDEEGGRLSGSSEGL
jgi:maltose alpha-D-glucosyltransferase/alpha-amylase